MGFSNINIPPIPSKEGTYEYKGGNLVYKPKGSDKRTIVALYIPPKRDPEETNKVYKARITADVNRVIAEIETSKDEVDAKARKHAINSTYELGDTGLTFASALEKARRLFNGIEGKITKDDITIPGIMVKSARAKGR